MVWAQAELVSVVPYLLNVGPWPGHIYSLILNDNAKKDEYDKHQSTVPRSTFHNYF